MELNLDFVDAIYDYEFKPLNSLNDVERKTIIENIIMDCIGNSTCNEPTFIYDKIKTLAKKKYKTINEIKTRYTELMQKNIAEIDKSIVKIEDKTDPIYKLYIVHMKTYKLTMEYMLNQIELGLVRDSLGINNMANSEQAPSGS